MYVAQVAMGADPNQTLKAIREAEAYDYSSIVICYCPHRARYEGQHGPEPDRGEEGRGVRLLASVSL